MCESVIARLREPRPLQVQSAGHQQHGGHLGSWSRVVSASVWRCVCAVEQRPEVDELMALLASEADLKVGPSRLSVRQRLHVRAS